MGKLREWCDSNIDKTISHVYDRCREIVMRADVIILQVSGGKDSGLSAEMILDAWKEYNSKAKIIFSFTHCEWFYTESLNYIHEFIEDHKDMFHEIYYKCLPLEWGNGIETFKKLISWENGKDWVQPMPDYDYVITEKDAQWIEYGMHEKIEQDTFTQYMSEKYKGQEIYQIVSIRQDESPERRTILYYADDETGEYSNCYGIHVCSPIKDLHVSDLWQVYTYCGWKYNKIYDLLYEAGVPVNKQRIASLLNSYAMGNLYMLRMLEPELFLRVNSRFNDTEMYTSRMRGFFEIEKPKNVPWNGSNHIHPDTTIEECDKLEQYLKDNKIQYNRNEMKFELQQPIKEIMISSTWRDYALHLMNSCMGDLRSSWQESLITEIGKVRWQAVPVGPSIIDAIKILDELHLLEDKTGIKEYKIFQQHPRSNMTLVCFDTIPYQSIHKEIVDMFKNDPESLKKSKKWLELEEKWQKEIKSCREERLKLPVPTSKNSFEKNVKIGCFTYFREDIKSTASWKRLACAILKNDLKYFSV